LIGFSSGGGFVLRIIGGVDEEMFDRFILISPTLRPDSPTTRRGKGWVRLVMLPRIVVLALLHRVGIDWFSGLPIVAYSVPPKATNFTAVYSYRLAVDFGAPRDYLARLRRSTKPVALLIGGADELYYPKRFGPLLTSVRPELSLIVVPDTSHLGMVVSPAGVATVRKAYVDFVAPHAMPVGDTTK
jgi:non-heme chloroperoxidase